MRNVRAMLQEEPKPWRNWFCLICEVFVLYSMVRSVSTGLVSDALVCLLVAAGVCVPYVLEYFWGWRMSDAIYVFSLLYLLASMSGRIYKLYYLIAHWDKLLHLCGGVVFALLGSYLPLAINKKYRDDLALRLLFAVMFSISLSALWEFYEFGMDRLFGMDMQRDTIVTAIHSYDLGDATGVIGSIDKIDSIIINGVPMKGYLDIGLIDTMGDMMIETLGALAYALLCVLDKGRHPAFTSVTPRRLA